MNVVKKLHTCPLRLKKECLGEPSTDTYLMHRYSCIGKHDIVSLNTYYWTKSGKCFVAKFWFCDLKLDKSDKIFVSGMIFFTNYI